MKFNYNKFKEMNVESLVVDDNNGYASNLSCFHVIQFAVDAYMGNGDMTEHQKELLLDLGVLEEEEKKNTVSPHKFVG